MSRIVFTALVLFLLSCSNETSSDKILSEQPFKILSDSIRLSPEMADLYYRRGVLLYQNDHVQLAKNDITKAWNLEPKEDYALSLATVIKKTNEDSAIVFLQEALKRVPGSIALRISLARGYQKKKEIDKAMAICDNILSEYPNQIDALILKSELYKTNGNYPEALKNLETAYIYAPADVELVHTLAFDYAEAKNPKAVSLSDSLIRNDMNEIHPEPYYFKGVYYLNTGNETEALKQFDLAIKRDYYFLDAHMEKGQIFYKKKDYPQALQIFKLVTTITPTFADAYFWIAKTQEAIGKKEEAKLNYQRAYGLDNSIIEAKEAAARL